ncbi:hypothetical protein V6N11_013241 [Hibiscus sabdariffa]|uniref:Uncharacterized protein n=1 Tax=Hibiscus sabdariffa TaxID=183260 RepID=A0ABR2NAQ7_9ROSI
MVQDLSSLVKGSFEPIGDLVYGFEFAPIALGGLLSYVELLADEGKYGNYCILRYNLVRALKVLESKNDGKLFGLMNGTFTLGMGKWLLHMWLKHRLLDVRKINTVDFLSDTWICKISPLINFCSPSASSINGFASMNDSNGEWSWTNFEHQLPLHILLPIAAIKPQLCSNPLICRVGNRMMIRKFSIRPAYRIEHSIV